MVQRCRDQGRQEAVATWTGGTQGAAAVSWVCPVGGGITEETAERDSAQGR